MIEDVGTVGLILVIIVLVVFAIFWITALIDIIRGKFNGGDIEKIIWIIVIIALPLIGLIIYYLFGKNNKVN